MKYIKLITNIFIISVLSACSNGAGIIEPEATAVSSNPQITAEAISVTGDKQSTEEQFRKTQLDIIGITRKEAGLSTISPLDSAKFIVNKRLKELLAAPESYKNSDYKNGIVIEREVLVSERFKDNIVNDLKIGTDIDYVKKVLGQPNVTSDIGFVFYKTKDYYLGFKGYSKVECAILVNRSIPNDKDILRLIVEQLEAENDIGEILYGNQSLAALFDESGHINGGGWYRHSYSGIEIVQFDSKTITIYNNYEADLYKVKDFKYDIKFVDSDYQVKNAINTIQAYIADNYEFDTLGVLSPSGKLKCTYYWGYSMSYYFKIRTLDNSKPDFRVSVPARDFKWLTDDYILYLNNWFTEPYIVKVSENTPYESINIMFNLGVFDKDDSVQDSPFNFSIKSINGNIITLYDSESNKEYKVEYSIGNKGIEVKLAN